MTPARPAARRSASPWLAILVLTGLTGCNNEITDADIRNIDIGEVRALTLRQAAEPDARLIVLIDPRAQARYDAAHLPGARNIKLPQVPEKTSIDPSISAFKHVIVYGTDPGNAAARAMTKRLMHVGYKGVRLFAGGVSEWIETGYAVESAPVPEPAPEPDPTP
jgi:3-mercaptopyruvate sulfurtransferase SseA